MHESHETTKRTLYFAKFNIDVPRISENEATGYNGNIYPELFTWCLQCEGILFLEYEEKFVLFINLTKHIPILFL
jgi:hypothetical protein